MAKNNIAAAARAFSCKWSGQGYEKGQTQQFWMELLQKVLGVEDPYSFIQFEGQLKDLRSTSFMDAYIPSTKVLIEQKSSKIDLSESIRQSDGSLLTPFEQARKYIVHMPLSMHPRWLVTCNFREFRVYDMEKPTGEPDIISLENIDTEYYRLQFLVDNTKELHKKEVEVSMAAGAIIGEIYEALHKEYKNPDDPHSLRSLNIICVRLVFCLYAEDAGLFDSHTQFHDYLVQFKPGTGDMRRALIDLFDTLNTPVEKRDPYLRDDLAAFPYVNGGLFAEKDVEIPRFNDKIATLLLKHASSDFDWSVISPTIFGGVFESTLNPETRRKGGMHYTSIENIHKVIDPLFFTDLKEELADIKAEPLEKKRIARAKEFQDKIASLTFLDPACGSGNFLTETFLSLRRLENEALRIIYKGQMVLGGLVNPIKVSISQFYGIEINDFAVSVAMTALWIAEAQMLFETEKIMQVNLDFLPLKSYTNIHEGNALRMYWNEVLDTTNQLIIGSNPPFLGARIMSKEQKDDLISVFGSKWKNIGNMDYVTGWYRKIVDLMHKNPSVKAALVSTNSICQGEQVANLWKPLMEEGVHIDFAWRTFIWDSEANQKAHVHCVIVGFSLSESIKERRVFEGSSLSIARNINGYLIDGDNVFIESRQHPICDVPEIGIGNKPIDGGFYLFKDNEKEEFVQKEPGSEKYFRRWYGSDEFINRRPRWCLWLGDANPVDLLKLPECLKRIEAVRDYRLASPSEGTIKLADKPTRFHVENMPSNTYLLIPRVSSEKRIYIPIGFMSREVLTSDSAHIVMGATLYHFGVLTSLVHNAWMRVVCGRLEMRYRYSKEIVYNNFPWPEASEEQKAIIEKTAQSILDAREIYPDASFADMYGNLIIFPELMKAHRANDAAVLEAYGFRKDMTEAEIVAELFKMYQKLVLGK